MTNTFPQVGSDEEVIMILQDHWILLAKPFLIVLFGWIFFILLFLAAGPIKIAAPLVATLLLLVAFLILLTAHHFFFIFVFEWMVSCLVITTKQIIDFRFFPFLEDDVAYIEIDQIHEMEKKKHGLLRNILNYGDIYITGIGTIIQLRGVRRPSKIVDFIEALKFKKDFSKLDLRSIGASYSKKYSFLKR